MIPEKIHRLSLKIHASDVDRFQHLRMSRLFQLMQEISIAHTENLGYPKETTLDKGMLWVISRMHVRLKRPISYDEKITLESWPEHMIHMVYPRRYRLIDEEGDRIGDGAALWMLIDSQNRRFKMPKDSGVIIDGPEKPADEEYPEGLPKFVPLHERLHHVTYSELDLNGHVNNTQYLNWIDDLFGLEDHKKGLLKEIQMNFQKEITDDVDVKLAFREEEKNFQAEGILPDGTVAFQAKGKLF